MNKRNWKSPCVLRLTMAATLLSLATFAASDRVLADGFGKRLEVDVAMIDQTFFDFEANPDPGREGIPPNGSPFIIQGWIYKSGTFERFGVLSGVNADGSPQFPDRVIGKWICRGWHLQDGDALSGPIVATTQTFDFSRSRPGTHTIVTDGIELADFDVPFKRAVTGGTGVFRRVNGESEQTYVGFPNASGSFNSSFRFRLSHAARHRSLHFPDDD